MTTQKENNGRKDGSKVRKVLAAAVGGLAAYAFVSMSSAALLLNYKPLPVSPSDPEFIWDGLKLSEGSGNLGNADGTLSPTVQTPGGLQIETPLTIAGAIPGKSINTSTGSTTFYDVTLETVMFASGPAVSFAGIVVQPVNEGRFRLTSTDPDGGGPELPTLLLEGTTGAGVVNGLSAGSAGGVLNGNVTYTAGAIYDALVAVGGTTTGSLSWSMLDITPTLAVGDKGNLRPFAGNATGLFSVSAIPEPASMALFGLGAITLIARRRRA